MGWTNPLTAERPEEIVAIESDSPGYRALIEKFSDLVKTEPQEAALIEFRLSDTNEPRTYMVTRMKEGDQKRGCHDPDNSKKENWHIVDIMDDNCDCHLCYVEAWWQAIRFVIFNMRGVITEVTID